MKVVGTESKEMIVYGTHRVGIQQASVPGPHIVVALGFAPCCHRPGALATVLAAKLVARHLAATRLLIPARMDPSRSADNAATSSPRRRIDIECFPSSKRREDVAMAISGRSLNRHYGAIIRC